MQDRSLIRLRYTVTYLVSHEPLSGFTSAFRRVLCGE